MSMSTAKATARAAVSSAAGPGAANLPPVAADVSVHHR